MGIVVFRADASLKNGAGHIRRCLVLANALAQEGFSCMFATWAQSELIVPAISAFPILHLSDKELFNATAMRELWPKGCDLLVLDNYQIASDYESSLREWAARIFVIDDLANRKHDCDFLLDQTFGRSRNEYEHLVPHDCNILVGSMFALLRPEFAAARSAALLRRSRGEQVKRIMVSLGGTDPTGATSAVLGALADAAPEVEVDVVYGVAPANVRLHEGNSSDLPKKVHTHFLTERMAEIATNADLAIGAAGTSTWERCCVGLPTITLVLAENQRSVADALVSSGGAVVTDLMGLRAAITELLESSEARISMSAQASFMCDGLGVRRVLSELVPINARNGRAVTLRPASMDDASIMLAWQHEPAVRAFSRTTRVPHLSEHLAWLEAKLHNPSCMLAIIECDHVPAGVVRLDPPNAVGRREVSIYVGMAHHRQGIACAALTQLRRLVPLDCFEAHVLAGNDASSRLFSAAGYLCHEPGLYVSSPVVALQ